MSLIATRMQALRQEVPQFDKNMTRPEEYGALDFFASQTESGRSFVTPELIRRAMGSIGNTLQIPVIKFDADVSVSNARTCTIADNDNESALVTVSFATYAVGFTMIPALHINNDISYKHDFQRKTEKTLRALANALDIAAVAALEAGKTQVFKDLLIYTQAGNDVQVPWDLRTEILGDLDVMQRANGYPGQEHIIGNAGIASLISKLAQHGLYNDVNKQLEYAGKVFHFTNNIVNETGKYATAYAVEDGNVGIVTRSGRENLLGTKSNDHEWDIVRLPILDIPVDTHYYTAVTDSADQTGEADMNCVVKEYFGFAVDVAFLTSYNSDMSIVPNPIIKAEIARSTGNPAAIPVIHYTPAP